MYLLLAGLSAGTWAQGGYHGPGRLVLVVTVGAATVLALVAARPAVAELRSPFVLAAVALAGWSLGRGATTAEPSSGWPLALLLAGVVGVVLVVGRLDAAQRADVTRGLTVLGMVVAATGWIGVVWHREPWALTNDAVWRATSSLTYANATAAVLVPLVLLSLGRLATQRDDTGLALMTTVLLIGSVATLSRAGAVSLACGLLVLGALAGPLRVATAAAGPALGAGVGVAGLVGSVPLDSAAGRPVAVGALALGLCCTALVVRLPVSVQRAVLAAAATVVLGFAMLAGAQDTAVSGVVRTRIEAGSSPRTHAAAAAVNLVADHPLTGVGPGAGPITWPGDDGSVQAMRYLHDEYLQVLLALGLPGLVLLLGLLAATAAVLRRARHGFAGSALPAAVAAGLAAAAVHAGFDFVWHVPVVPLLLAALLGLVTDPPSSARTRPSLGNRLRPHREVE
jgi:hypothetical protein